MLILSAFTCSWQNIMSFNLSNNSHKIDFTMPFTFIKCNLSKTFYFLFNLLHHELLLIQVNPQYPILFSKIKIKTLLKVLSLHIVLLALNKIIFITQTFFTFIPTLSPIKFLHFISLPTVRYHNYIKQ